SLPSIVKAPSFGVLSSSNKCFPAGITTFSPSIGFFNEAQVAASDHSKMPVLGKDEVEDDETCDELLALDKEAKCEET
ncbi:MAG TPA: hypothetical protein PK002_06895, partial [Cellvibrio sp.]|nr:hypothetical protein [Cellvibrio sp.]